MIEISSCMNSIVIWHPPSTYQTTNKQQNHNKPYKTIPYLHLSITAISIHNATLLPCHFQKIATVSHFRLVVCTSIGFIFPPLSPWRRPPHSQNIEILFTLLCRPEIFPYIFLMPGNFENKILFKSYIQNYCRDRWANKKKHMRRKK